jgi:hypothetical protein
MCPPPVPNLSQLDPVHTTTSHLLKVYRNIIVPSTPGSLPSGFPTKTLYTPLLSPIRATRPAHHILLDFITLTILGERSTDHHAPHCVVFSDTISLRSSLNVSDQVSHPYKTTGKIIVPCILIFKFLDSKLEDKRFCTE